MTKSWNTASTPFSFIVSGFKCKRTHPSVGLLSEAVLESTLLEDDSVGSRGRVDGMRGEICVFDAERGGMDVEVTVDEDARL